MKNKLIYGLSVERLEMGWRDIIEDETTTEASDDNIKLVHVPPKSFLNMDLIPIVFGAQVLQIIKLPPSH